jgi:hypothetical protein
LITAVVVDGDFHRVDLLVAARHLLAEPAVALHERRDRLLELLLDEAAHLQHVGAHALQIVVVTTQDVMRQVRLFHDGARVTDGGCIPAAPTVRKSGTPQNFTLKSSCNRL